MIRIVIVDDDPLVRAGLRAILDSESDIGVVGEGADGSQLPSLVSSFAPDVVLMDVRMPNVDGITATKRLVLDDARADIPKVLVMTTFENDSYVYDALCSGASGFVLKRSGADHLITAIRTLATTDSLLFPSALRQLIRVQKTLHHNTLRPSLPDLTNRESEVLRGIARGLNNAEIARELFVGTETVKTYVGTLLAKLGVRDRTQAAIAAYESGFIELS